MLQSGDLVKYSICPIHTLLVCERIRVVPNVKQLIFLSKNVFIKDQCRVQLWKEVEPPTCANSGWGSRTKACESYHAINEAKKGLDVNARE